jgi:hypothetical protein
VDRRYIPHYAGAMFHLILSFICYITHLCIPNFPTPTYQQKHLLHPPHKSILHPHPIQHPYFPPTLHNDASSLSPSSAIDSTSVSGMSESTSASCSARSRMNALIVPPGLLKIVLGLLGCVGGMSSSTSWNGLLGCVGGRLDPDSPLGWAKKAALKSGEERAFGVTGCIGGYLEPKEALKLNNMPPAGSFTCVSGIVEPSEAVCTPVVFRIDDRADRDGLLAAFGGYWVPNLVPTPLAFGKPLPNMPTEALRLFEEPRAWGVGLDGSAEGNPFGALKVS